MKTAFKFPNGPTIEADFTKVGLLALHKPLTGGKGYVLSHVPTGRLVLRTRLAKEARDARRELEAMDWENDLGAIQEIVNSTPST